MSLQTLEELITTQLLVSRTGQYFWPLLQTTKLLKKNIKKLEAAQHSTTASICSAKYTHKLTIFAEIMRICITILTRYETGWFTAQFMQNNG